MNELEAITTFIATFGVLGALVLVIAILLLVYLPRRDREFAQVQENQQKAFSKLLENQQSMFSEELEKQRLEHREQESRERHTFANIMQNSVVGLDKTMQNLTNAILSNRS